MTLVLSTLSHGEVEGGYFAYFTEFSRLGEYAFPTRNFLDMARGFADHPGAKEGTLLCYDLDRFWARFAERGHELFEAMPPQPLERFEGHVDQVLSSRQGQASLEDVMNLRDEGRILPVRISEGDADIELGRYRIANDHFAFMCRYLARGGWLGWSGGEGPDYARSALQAFKASQRRLFKKA